MKIVIGTIYSTLTGEPFPGATVQEVGTTSKVVTDSNGRFSMSVASELSYLKISAPDYKDTTVQVALFSISNTADIEPVTGTQLPGMILINKENKVNWFGVVALTALLSLGGAVLYSNSQKKASAVKTVKAKI